MKPPVAFCLLVLPFLAACVAVDATERPAPPNILLIVVDDLGYGDLGCFGQERIATPNLDRLAAEGRRFTHFYAGSTVCAPSRCALFTGRHTGHCPIRGNGKDNLALEDVTIAEVLKEAGYATGLVGKWGIGHEGSTGLPTRQGFDSFFGYLDQHHAHNFYPTFLVRDEERVSLPNVVPDEGKYGQGVATEKVAYSHDLLTEEALAFLEREQDGPFFLCLTWTIPHANNEARKKGMEVPELGEFANADWPEPEKGFAAMVTRMDHDVGRLVAKLEELGVAENTLVFFTSDNGPHSEGGHRSDFFDSNGPLRGQKRDLLEGGIRVPTIARWPPRIPAGTSSTFEGAFWDLMPTFAELACVPEAVPAECDGISLVAALEVPYQLGRRKEHPLYWAFYERGGGRALVRGPWKVIEQPMHTPPRLYRLDRDIAEEHDLSAHHPELLAELVSLMDDAYTPSERWRFPEPPEDE